MQGDTAKHAVIAEAARLLRPGGRYAVHELALTPDAVARRGQDRIRRALARSIKVNARPADRRRVAGAAEEHGLVVDHVDTAPMALLQPRRMIADEGVLGALRFVRHLLTHPDARRRVIAIRRTFRAHRSHLCGRRDHRTQTRKADGRRTVTAAGPGRAGAEQSDYACRVRRPATRSRAITFCLHPANTRP